MEKSLRKINVDILFYVILFIFFTSSLLFAFFFRDAIKDETLYIHETYLISELFRNGIWLGDYAVGLHGFLFKIPPALIFLVTGYSLFVLTVYNIIFACLACVLFYKLLREAFGWRINAILALLLLMVNFHFLVATPTYLREMPSLFVITLLLYGIFKNWRPWILGLVFLLLLDVKEYLFFMFGLGYFVWICVKYFKIHVDLSFFEKTKRIFLESLQIYGFSILLIVFMFTTSLIPVNMFLASILGLISIGVDYLATHFSVDVATLNLLNDEDAKTIFQFVVHEDYPVYLQMILNIFNTILSYIGKILYPKTFSFSSVPKVLILPSVYMAIKSLKMSLGKNSFKSIFPILLLAYLFIYLLRASIGRYLLPIVPLIAIYFVTFLNFKFENKKEVKKVLLATLLFIIGGFFFESGHLLFKILIELSLFACICISVLEPIDISKKFYIFFRKLTLVFCIILLLIIGLRFLATDRQAKYSRLFGENREMEKIVDFMPENSKVWINNYDSYALMLVYAGETYSWPEWKWDLASIVPKRNLLKGYGEKEIYNERWDEIAEFKEDVLNKEIEYVVFLESEVEDEEFELQEFLPLVEGESWLVKENEKNLKNTKIYLFKVDLK